MPAPTLTERLSTTPTRRRSTPSRCSRNGSRWPATASPTTRTPWRWRPSMPPACPTSAWCCSTPATAAASASSPISRAPRASSCWPTPRPRCCFHWKSLRRQVRVRGPVEVVHRSRGRRLFRDPRRAARQLGAHASQQSRPLASRAELVEPRRDARREPRGRPGDPARPLVGLPAHPAIDRVLEGRRLPPPRPRAVHARHARTRRGRASGSIPEACLAGLRRHEIVTAVRRQDSGR